MSLLRRLAVIFSVALVGSLAFAAGAIAATGGLAPGSYVFTNTSADATFGVAKGGAPTAQGFSVFVNRGLNSYQPEDGKGQRTITNSTMVQLSMFSASGSTFGCFTIDPSNFKVNKSLQSASLHATLTATDACLGAGAPVTGKSDIIPAPGAVGGLQLPISIDLTWTGLGVTATSRNRSSFACLDYSTQSTNISHTARATVSGTISTLSGPLNSDISGVSTTDTRLEISGTTDPRCFSF